jgi:hypothetical protein
MIQDLRDMGMSESDIRRVLKKNNIGGVKGIMRGKFEPFKVTKKNRQEMRDAGISDKFDNDAYAAIYRQMQNLPLDPEVERPAPRISDPSIVDPFKTGPSPVRVPSAPAIVDPFKQGSLPQPTPTITQARATGPVNPALLGGNPAERAANAFLQG